MNCIIWMLNLYIVVFINCLSSSFFVLLLEKLRFAKDWCLENILSSCPNNAKRPNIGFSSGILIILRISVFFFHFIFEQLKYI